MDEEGNSVYELPSFLNSTSDRDADSTNITNDGLSFDIEKAHERIGISSYDIPSFSSDMDNECDSTLALIDCDSDNIRVKEEMSAFRNKLASYNKRQSSDLYHNMDFNPPKKLKNIPSDITNISSSLSAASLKIKMKRMEVNHAASVKALELSKIGLESKLNILSDENDRLEERYSTLQLENKRIMEKMLELHEQQEENAMQKDAIIVELKENLATNSELHQDTESRLRYNLQNISEMNNELKVENSDLNLRVVELSTQCEEKSARLSQLIGMDTELTSLTSANDQLKQQLIKAQHEISDLTYKLSNISESVIQANAFKEELSDLKNLRVQNKSLIRENMEMKAKKENYQMLNEKYIICQNNLNRVESKVTGYESEIIELKKKLTEAEMVSLSKKEVTSDMHYLEDRVAQLQKQIEQIEDKNSDLKMDLNEIQAELVTEKGNVSDLTQNLKDKSECCSSLSVQSIRLKSKMHLLAQERDSLRSILQSYDAEMTMDAHKSLMSKRLEEQIESNSKLHIHIQNLEKRLDEQSGVKLPMSVSKPISDEPDTKSADIQDLKAELQTLKDENSTLKAKNEHLETLFEDRHLKGDYNPDSTKVLHFTMNPADVAAHKFKSEIQELKTENRLLRTKIKELEKGHEVSMSGLDFSNDYKDQLNRAELKNLRLKEAFSRKIQQFRSACYTLTGYKIDGIGEIKYKLTSMYSESEEDFLIFQMKSDGTLQLIETQFSKTKMVEEMIALHLHHQNSYPVFLSALTTNLFSQTTLIE